MKTSSDFRKIARDALSRKWRIAVLITLVACLLGAISLGPEFDINIESTGLNFSLTYFEQTIYSTTVEINPYLSSLTTGRITIAIIVAATLFALFFMVSSFIKVGYAKFTLHLIDRQEATMDNLFSQAFNWKTTVLTRLLTDLYVILWSLLFIIPGIMACYSYAMTDYILADHPEISASEAVRRSKEMMEGNRFRLFCLEFSFIGWSILSKLTFGIGKLGLTPYVRTATAAFYREISETENYYSEGTYEDGSTDAFTE